VLFGSATMIVLQLIYTYAPFMNKIFQSEPISGFDWLLIIAVSVAVYIVVDVEKWVRRRVLDKPA
jgi:Ca2+-transporting ATPase